jgi:hypothetical protein
MQRVFICYRRDDSKSVSSRIYDRLAAEFGRQNVFKDVNVIPAGVDFREFIQNEIAKTDTVLVIIGTRWVSLLQQRLNDPADYVRLEIESAFKQGKRVIPVLVEGARPPTASDLPESIARLAYLNTARVDDDPDFHPHMDKLVAQLIESSPRRRLRLPRAAAGLAAAAAALALLVIGAVFAASSTNPSTPIADEARAALNLTATARALPVPGANSPTISSFGGMFLLSEPTDSGVLVGSVSEPVPIIGRTSDRAYVLVAVGSRHGWIRINNFMQVSGSLDRVPVVSFVAPTLTPAADVTATPRPSPTPRPTSEFAPGWLVNATANFDGGLPVGWQASDSGFITSVPNAPLTLTGRGFESDVLRRSGFFANSGTRTFFSLTGDANGFFAARFFLTQGVPGQSGFRYFGLEPVEGTSWRLVSAFDNSGFTTVRELLLLPDRVYDLTILLEGSSTFFVTLVDQETGTRIIDGERFQMGAVWSARVGDPIFFGVNPLAGATFLQRVDTLLRAL